MDLPDLRTHDVLILLAVRRCGTVTGASREMGVTPSQVSKSVARMERQIGVKLLARTARGMIISEAGQRLMPHLEEIIARVRQLPTAKEGPLELITVAAPSSMINVFLPLIAESQPEVRFRGLQMAPSLIRQHAGDGLFQLALAADHATHSLPAPWSSTPFGRSRKALFAPPSLAWKLGQPPVPLERIRKVPFVSPIFVSNGEFLPVDDDCPLSYAERRVGHQAQTIDLAFELAIRTQQLVFGPTLAAKAHLDSGRLVEVPVEGWNVQETLYLISDGDRVLAKAHKAIVAALRSATEGMR